MRVTDRKEYTVVAIIFLAAVIIFTLISLNRAEIITEAPDQPAILAANDMLVPTPSGNMVVGKSTRSEVIMLYPEGTNLGRSGVYRPKDLDCLLSFSKHEDVLIRVDLGFCDLSTSRGIKVNESFDKVVQLYGNGYTKSFDKDKPQVFDAYYGSDQYILFKIEDNLVKKIYIGSPVQ